MIPANADILNRKINALLKLDHTGYANVLRDANQSLHGGTVPARLSVEAEKHAHKVGYSSIQVSGGTRTHVPMMKGYNPFDENRVFRTAYPDELLTCLVRGDASFVYKPQPDDVTEELLKQMILSGINGYTIFDGLGDTRQQEFEIKTINKFRAEGHPVFAQAGLLIGSAPYMDLDYYRQRADRLMKANPQMFYLKDAVGDSDPEMNARVVELLKKEYKLPVQIHVHYTHGTAKRNLVSAFEAGANILDVLHPSLAGNTGHASVLDIHAALKAHANPAVKGRVPKINEAAIHADTHDAGLLRLQYLGAEPKYNKDTRAAMKGGRAPGGAAGPLRGQFDEHFKNTYGMEWAQSERLIYAMMEPLLPLLGWPTMVTPHAKNTAAQAASIILLAVANDPNFKITMESERMAKEIVKFMAENGGISGEQRESLKQKLKNAPAAPEIAAQIILSDYVTNPEFVKSALIKRMTPDITDYLTGRLGEIPGQPDAQVQQEALKRANLTEVVKARQADLLEPRMEATRERLIADRLISKPVDGETEDEAAARIKKDIKPELVVLAALELPKLDEGYKFAVAAHKGELRPEQPPELRTQFQQGGRLGPVAGFVMQVAVNAVEIQRLNDSGSADPVTAQEILKLEAANRELLNKTIPDTLKKAGREKHALGRALQAVNVHLAEIACGKEGLGLNHEFLPQIPLNFQPRTMDEMIEVVGLDSIAAAAEHMMHDAHDQLEEVVAAVEQKILAVTQIPAQVDAALEVFYSRVKAEVTSMRDALTNDDNTPRPQA